MNLQAFCDPKHERSACHAPFSRREYSYGTDGYIIVRVPGFDFLGLPPGQINDRDIERWWPAVEPEYWWTDMPIVEKPHGKGVVATMIPCGDSARVYIQAKYLYLIRRECGPTRIGAIPSCGRYFSDLRPCKFTFDGGDGLVMPVWI